MGCCLERRGKDAGLGAHVPTRSDDPNPVVALFGLSGRAVFPRKWEAAGFCVVEEAAEAGTWVLMDEKEKLKSVGAPGHVTTIAVNMVKRLGRLLKEQAIVGSGTGSHLVNPKSSSNGEHRRLSGHCADLVADAAVFLWCSCAVPMLAQLDSGAADLPTVPVLKRDNSISTKAARKVQPKPVADDTNVNTDDKPAAPAPVAAATMPDPLDVRLLQDILLAIHSSLSLLQFDDPVLRATVGLRLSLILGDPNMGNDLRRAIQVNRGALKELNACRCALGEASLHAPTTSDDLTALTRATITCDVDDEMAALGRRRPGASGLAGASVFGAASILDPLAHALASLHTDLVVIKQRLELRLGMVTIQISSPVREPTRAHTHSNTTAPAPTEGHAEI